MTDSATTPIRALFFDMDGTLLTRRPGAPNTIGPYNLFHILEEMAIQNRLPATEIKSRMNRLREKDMFWEWAEFIVALELDPVAFWDFAYHREVEFLGPTTPELVPMMERLKAAGFQLYITSNNPLTGILHKLRILGLGDMHGAPLFSQLLGFSDIRALKTDSEFWLRALARTGWAPADVAVIGVPDDKYGEELAAWIILKPGASASEEAIREFCRGQIAHYKIPRYVRFKDELPMTVTGKPQKFLMREAMADELGVGGG